MEEKIFDHHGLKIIIDDINTILNGSSGYIDNISLNELTKLIYFIESELNSIKVKLDLPYLNPSILSDIVLKSFKNNSVSEPNGNFLRPVDYQFWLLGFLLIKNKEIRDYHLSLFQIIDEFISKIKNQSFSWEDVEYTGSGATRCKTNIRFAYNELKDMGMVYLYDKTHKNSWSLTFVGFFLAVSFYLDKQEDNIDILSDKIFRFNFKNNYYKINIFLIDRMHQLSQSNYFMQIVNKIKNESLNLPELIKGPEIFHDYFYFMKNDYTKRDNETERKKSLSDFLDKINVKYPLKKYMDELTLKFNAEIFFKNLIE